MGEDWGGNERKDEKLFFWGWKVKYPSCVTNKKKIRLPLWAVSWSLDKATALPGGGTFLPKTKEKHRKGRKSLLLRLQKGKITICMTNWGTSATRFGIPGKEVGVKTITTSKEEKTCNMMKGMKVRWTT